MTSPQNMQIDLPCRGLLLVGPTGAGKTPLGDCIESRGLWNRRWVHFDFAANLREAVAQNRPDGFLSLDDLSFLRRVLETGANAVQVDPALIPRARQPIDRMLAFTAALKNGQPTGSLVPHLGAA